MEEEAQVVGMNEVNDVYQNYFSQAINWFESAINNTNDDSFSSLQMTCLQNFLSACFKQTETLDKNGKRHMRKVHRLVAQEFIDNPDNKKCVDHKNNIRTDNKVTN